MKQKDLALIAVIVVVSGIISLVVSNDIFKSSKSQLYSYTVQPIYSNLTQPSSQYFNSSSVDPTQVINISQNNNPNPFSAAPSQ